MNSLIGIEKNPKNPNSKLITLTHQEILFESEVSMSKIDENFYTDGRKKIVYVPKGTVINLDKKYARRSLIADVCDAAIIHLCLTPMEKLKLLTQVAKADEFIVKDVFKLLGVPFINYENELAHTDIYFKYSDVVGAALTTTGHGLIFSEAYTGQEFSDIKTNHLKIFNDRDYTEYQNRFGAEIDDFCKSSLINMISTNDDTNIKLAVIQMSYANLTPMSKQNITDIIKQFSKNNKLIDAIVNEQAGRSLLNVLNITL